MELATAKEVLNLLAHEPVVRPFGQGDTLLYPRMSSSSNPQIFALSMMIQKPHRDRSIPSAPLSPLTPISLSNLQPRSRAAGRVLHGTLAAEPIKLGVQVVTVLLDPTHEDEAILLAVKYAVQSRATQEEVRAAFPRGARVAIKEPILVQQGCNLPFISLDNPASFVVISYLREQQLEALRGMSPAEIRARGNSLFNCKAFNSAAEAYRLSSDRAKQLELVDPRDQLLALSNRAECMLKLGLFEDCIDAAEEALSLDPAHPKSIYRKGSALINLHLYTWASTFLESFTGIDSSINELHSRARNLAEQSHRSTSVLEEFTRYVKRVTTVTPPVKPPELAQYVGPIEVRMCPDQKFDRGRGLFATRSIKRGDVVMVSNAMSFQQRGGISECIQDAAVDVLAKVMRSHRAFHQIKSLASETVLSDLGVPEMKLFQPNWIIAEDWGSYRKTSSRELLQDISVKSIFEAVNTVSFHPGGAAEDGFEVTYHATWLLPSFINHCCVPNVCRTVLGESVVFLAAREIEAGEELGFSYIYSGHPYRLKRLQEENLNCECLKCELQRKLEPELEEVNDCYMTRPDGGPRPVIKGRSDVPAMVMKLENVLRTRLGSEDERQCMRAVHWSLYCCYYRLVRKGKAPRGLDPGAEVIMAGCRKFSAGTSGEEIEGLQDHATDGVLVEKMLREEWECRFGKIEDGVYQLVRNNEALKQIRTW